MEKVFNFVDLAQGSDEWIQFRKGKIGASEVPTICGVNPYQKRSDLLEEKITGKAKEISDYTKKIFQDGHEWEEIVRNQLSELGKSYSPVVCENIARPELLCSLDGINEKHDEILEVKTTSSKDIWNTVSLGDVPLQYLYQIQYQMYVTGIYSALLAVLHKPTKELKTLFISRDEEMIEKIILEVDSFLTDLNKYKMPVKVIENEAMSNIALTKVAIDKYKKLIKEEELKQKKLAEQILKQFPDALRVEGFGLSIEWSDRKGNIDYDSIPELQGVNLDLYRKPSKRNVKLTVINKKGNDNDE